MFHMQVVTPVLLLGCMGVEVGHGDSSTWNRRTNEHSRLMKEKRKLHIFHLKAFPGGPPSDNNLHLYPTIHILGYSSQYTYMYFPIPSSFATLPFLLLLFSSYQVTLLPPIHDWAYSDRWPVPSLPSSTTLTAWLDHRWQRATPQTLRCQLRFKTPCLQCPTRLTCQTCLWMKHLMREGLQWLLYPLPTSSTSSFSSSLRSASIHWSGHNGTGYVNMKRSSHILTLNSSGFPTGHPLIHQRTRKLLPLGSLLVGCLQPSSRVTNSHFPSRTCQPSPGNLMFPIFSEPF